MDEIFKHSAIQQKKYHNLNSYDIHFVYCSCLKTNHHPPTDRWGTPRQGGAGSPYLKEVWPSACWRMAGVVENTFSATPVSQSKKVSCFFCQKHRTEQGSDLRKRRSSKDKLQDRE